MFQISFAKYENNHKDFPVSENTFQLLNQQQQKCSNLSKSKSSYKMTCMENNAAKKQKHLSLINETQQNHCHKLSAGNSWKIHKTKGAHNMHCSGVVYARKTYFLLKR